MSILPPQVISKHVWLGFAGLFLAMGVVGIVLLPNPGSPTAQPPPMQPPPRPEVLNVLWEGDVNPTKPWTKVGLYAKSGERLYVRASGRVHWSDDSIDPDIGPAGANYTPLETDKPYLFPYLKAPCGEVLLRINKRMYRVGKDSVVVAREPGPVELGINDWPNRLYENTGQFHIIISSVPKTPGVPIAESETREEVADLIAEQKANEHERTNDCDCEKLPREEFGVDRWRVNLRKVGHWCTKGIHLDPDQTMTVKGPDYQDFQVLLSGEVHTSRSDWRSVFPTSPRPPEIVYFSATTPMTITVTVSK